MRVCCVAQREHAALQRGMPRGGDPRDHLIRSEWACWSHCRLVDLICIATRDDEAYVLECLCDIALVDLVVTSGKRLDSDPFFSVLLEYELLGANVRDVGLDPFVVFVLYHY